MSLLRAVRVTVIDYLLTVKSSSVASLCAAVAAGLAGLTARITQQSASHTQELVEQKKIIATQMLALKVQLAQAQAAMAPATPTVTSESNVLPVGNLVLTVALTVGNISADVLSVHLHDSDTALCDDVR